MTKRKRKTTNNDLQNITQKTKDRATRTTVKIRDESMYSGPVCSSRSTIGTRHVIVVANPVISHEKAKDHKVLTTTETCSLSFATHIFR